jgi:cell surface protein SprA
MTIMKLEHLRCLLAAVGFMLLTNVVFAANHDVPFSRLKLPIDTLPKTLKERTGDFINSQKSNRFDLKDPSIIDKKVDYDPTSGQYIISEKIGADYFRTPSYMTFEEYQVYKKQQQQQNYFRKLAGVSSGERTRGPLIDPVKKVDVGNTLIDRLFGGTAVSIVPQGNIDLTFGGSYQDIQNPILTEAQRTNAFFDFDMGIQMNVTGKIGEKLNLSTNFNNRATFNFENQIKLKYDTPSFSEDEIIKKLEAGNVSLPLRSSLIQGSQALFGVKTELQFGKLRLTGIVSQQKSKRENLQIQGGSQVRNFEVPVDEYDENRHFFLSQYNRNSFEPSLKKLPRINSLFKITRIELWVTNDRNVTQDVRDVIAMYDLGEHKPQSTKTQAFPIPKFKDIAGTLALADNRSNGLYNALIADPTTRQTGKVVSSLQMDGYKSSIDYEKIRARLLDVNREYTYNEDLGFISLNISLRPEQALAVAFEYTYNGVPYRVGEFTNELPKDPDNQSVVFVKLLKGTTPNVTLPIWDLMMKNIYSIGAVQLDGQDFRLDIFYDDAGNGPKRFLPTSNLVGKPLLNILNLDNLNQQNDPQPDGQFDFVQGITVNTRTGRIMFPVLEPFGKSLSDQIIGDADKKKYAFDPLYRNTITQARQFSEQNRFLIKGSYRSSISSEISLGSFNLPEGSVRVSAGAQNLEIGKDYEVNYSLGTVRILNPAYIQAGQPLNISFEDNTLFGLQQRSMIGLRADYEIKKNFNVGGTMMKLFERPFTNKVNLGEDPINNSIYGADVTYNQDAPWLTNLVDKLPFFQTKEASSIALYAEGALLRPNHSSAINLKGDDGGSVFYDDFEGGTSSFDLRQPAQSWAMSSVPQGKINGFGAELFPESNMVNDLAAGVNRASLSWYRLDNRAVTGGDDKNPYTSPVTLTEIFPNYRGGDVLGAGLLNIAYPLDIHYEPSRRGAYNFDVPGGMKPYSAGLSQSGNLIDPKTRWGGIMRGLTNTDFEQANVEAVEFWMLSPFLPGYGAETGGDLYLNLGNISEDILRDSRQYFENGLPTKANQIRTESTRWSVIPSFTPTTNGFDLQERETQDVGLDGVNDAKEREKFSDYLQKVKGGVNTLTYQAIETDPSNDNYKNYSDYPDKTNVFTRYSHYNGVEANSKPPKGETEYPNSNMPDMEEVNRDNNMNESEAYYQYRIRLEPSGSKGEIDKGVAKYVIDQREDKATGRIWYRFKIPIAGQKDTIGGLSGLRSMRFVRMFLHNFEEPVTLRFATLELVRNQWRKYERTLAKDDTGNLIPTNSDCTTANFDVTAVNVEQNSGKLPYNYMLPPGVQREVTTIGAATNNLQNEQSLALKINNLCDGDGRSIFKLQRVDMRVFKRLKMFVHAEAIKDRLEVKSGDLRFFIRFGSDFEKNYYQYEMPLTISTRPTTGGSTPSDSDREIVWDAANNLDILLEALIKAKTDRPKTFDITRLYQIADPANAKNSIGIVGNPNVGNVAGVMIGVKNPADANKASQSVEIWVNELRMNGFDERGGQAALMRVDMKLADLGNLAVSGNYSSIGWGALHQKVAQRSRFDNFQYDLATTLELGKFLPRTSGIRVPFYYQYSSDEKAPEYNPYDLDVKTRSVVDENIRTAAVEKTVIKSMNFTNVRKERTDLGKTPMPWDIENFSLTYAQSQTNRITPIMEVDNLSQTKGALDYNYSAQPKYFTPFKKMITNDKYLKLISEFNINPIPSTLTFNTSLDRNLGDRVYRFTDDTETYRYTKRFTWNRNYNLAWDLTKNLRMSFNAANLSVIDEPNGVTTRADIWEKIKTFGRNKNYTHGFTASYALPFKQIPYMDWIQIKASYGTTYGWSAAPLNSLELGNVIQNSQNKQLNGDFAFDQFYNQFKYLKKINEPLFNENSGDENKSKKRQRSDKKSDKTTDTTNSTDPSNPDATTTDATKPASKRRNPRATDREAEKGSVLTQPKTDGNAVEGVKIDKVAAAAKRQKEKKEREVTFAEKLILKPLMMIRRGRGTYSETYTSSVPGFMPNTELLGMSNSFGAPGAGYAFGAQPTTEWLDEAARQNWVTKELLLNQQVQQNYTQNIDARLTLEPIDEFRIDVDATRNYTRNHTELFKIAEASKGFEHLAERDLGTFTVSYFTMPTLFAPDITTVFKQFETNRTAVSAALNPTGKPHINDAKFGEYKEGFGRYQQEVLVPAFLAAYTNTDPLVMAKSTLFNSIPRPNWRVSYTGLSKIPGLRSLFQNITLTHGYKSTMTTNSYNTNLNFDPVNPLLQDQLTRNYYTRLIIPGLTISEQMSPVIGMDIRTKSDMSIRYDYRKTRNLLMSFVDYQLNETKTSEHVFGYTYRLKNVKIPFLYPKSQTKGKKKKDLPGNDMNIKMDFSLRDDISRIFSLDQNSVQSARGARTLRFSPSVDYTLNKQLNLRLFIDHNDTRPYTPNSFPIRTTRGGLTVRFSL